jgi:hypothetical protein
VNGTGSLTIPWQAYSSDGVPVDLVKQLREQIARVESTLSQDDDQLRRLRATLNAFIGKGGQLFMLANPRADGKCADKWAAQGRITLQFDSRDVEKAQGRWWRKAGPNGLEYMWVCTFER